ncbi:tellurite resistance/C4-dicarboxylate transporter family protein [Kordiimonas lipolytica]|uniref:Tellurite resistance/C4-dicarboxylate transporter family protein n=1 Tax=Kordiimonas lipolytica TaxID=1662421 RepID=A0ABV8U6I4_9PROT|nr:tellurite resistance/C4-dicarboxylate transporter family protein [Kordiimonas lipolytica]
MSRITRETDLSAIPAADGRILSLAYMKQSLAALHPAYFALVMATGIVSIGCKAMGLEEVATLLFWVNVPAYAILWLVYGARAWLFPSRFMADWLSHKRGFGFFTVVAATNVLGSQFFLLQDNVAAAEIFWWAGFILWLLCTYSIFVLLAVQKQKPPIEEGINGGWLIAVVATQSVSVLGALVKPSILGSGDFSAVLLLSFWLFGGMLYIWLISLIFYRYMFFRFEPSDLIPPYWINMGAVAITTLTGAELIRAFESTPAIHSMLPFIKGMTTMYWATATWWIPMLLVLGVWRHGIRRFKLTYDPLYWGLVFPLGMYAVCTLKLGVVFNLPMFLLVARVFIVVALIAWLLTFLSMIKRPLYAVLLMVRTRSRDTTIFPDTQLNEGDRENAQS